jgi:CD109 antigen
LIKKLLVDPPGDTIYMNKAVFLDLRAPEFANTPLERNISVNIPRTAVKGSERIFISSAPDPLGPPLNNLKNLLNIPPGGGEQNLLKLLPAVILADYMKKSGICCFHLPG